MSTATTPPIGFAPEEVDTAASTRDVRLKWVVVVDRSLPTGRAVNAAICVAAATADAVDGLLGPDATDADGSVHPGLPWIGCSVLGADAAQLAAVRSAAAGSLGVHAVDMPAAAQRTRVYDEYVAEVAGTSGGELETLAISLVGPRNRIDKLVKRLSLL
jgi:hypothetical protein